MHELAITHARSLPERHPWLTLAACLLAGAAISVLAGQDASWDLKNYHLYNAWAWLHDRGNADFAPAGMQSFFSPYLDLPYAWLALGPLRHWPRLLAAWQGMYAGIVFYLVWAIVAVAARWRGARMDTPDIAAVLIGVSGTALGSQIGVTSNEMQVAALVLAALWVLLKGLAGNAHQQHISWRHATLAGALAGAAAGLKLTAVVYVPALAAGLAFALVKRDGVRPVLIFLLAAGAAFLACYGSWGWHLWRLTGNPAFPLFNDVFHSSWTASTAATDMRFRPHGLLQWLFYPFWWAFKSSFVVTESRMRDGRFAFAFVAMLLLGASAWRHRRGMVDTSTRAHRLLAVFMVTAYAGWLALFSIYRYAIAIEALSGWAIMLALRRVLPGRGLSVTASVLTLLLIAGARYPNWGRTAYAGDVFDLRAPTLPAGALVVFVGQPQAYLAPLLKSRSSRFTSVTWLTAASRRHTLWQRTRNLIARHRGPVFAVLREHADKDLATLRAMHLPLRLDLARCQPVHSNIEYDRHGTDRGQGLRLCPLTAAHRLAQATLR